MTYFSGAFVFDGELALLLAVIDVAQLVVEQIRGRHRESGKKHRDQGREAAHRAAEPEHLKTLERWSGGVELQAALSSLCAAAAAAAEEEDEEEEDAAAAASARVLSAAPLIRSCSWRHAHHNHHHTHTRARTTCRAAVTAVHNVAGLTFIK